MFFQSGSLVVERQFLLLKNQIRSASLQAGALLLSELTIKALRWAKMKRKLGGARRKRKVRFYACANLKCENFCKIHPKKPLKSTWTEKHPTFFSRTQDSPAPSPGLRSLFHPCSYGCRRARPARLQHAIAQAPADMRCRECTCSL